MAAAYDYREAYSCLVATEQRAFQLVHEHTAITDVNERGALADKARAAAKALAFLADTYQLLDGERSPVTTPDEDWTDSGHGLVYPAGDPPGSLRARCGGPFMCLACFKDLEHSMTVGDSVAEQWMESASLGLVDLRAARRRFGRMG